MEQEFRMPDLGEGLAEAEVVRWLVAEGEEIRLNQLVAEVETAKAIVELPSPYAGTVTRRAVAEGQSVAVGAVLLAVDGANAERPQSPDLSTPLGDGGQTARDVQVVAGETGTGGVRADLVNHAAEPQEVANLVGTGPRASTGRVRGLRQLASAARERVATGADHQTPAGPRSPAAPPVRKYAKDHGLDLAHVKGSGPGGRILRSDLTRPLARGGEASDPANDPSESRSGSPQAPLEDQSGRDFGEVEQGERIPLTPLRRTAAAQMTLSATTIPQATAFLTLDATAILGLRERLRLLPQAQGTKLTPLAVISRSVCAAIAAYPLMNASLIDEGHTVLVHPGVHLGIATNTPFGLLVPTIRDAQRCGVIELAAAIERAAARARDRVSSVEELTGATFTITNVGALGIEAGAALVNPPQSAILAVGRIVERPWVAEGAVVVRPVMTLGVSFDHRVIDGAYAGNFLTHLQRVLEHPELLVA